MNDWERERERDRLPKQPSNRIECFGPPLFYDDRTDERIYLIKKIIPSWE